MYNYCWILNSNHLGINYEKDNEDIETEKLFQQNFPNNNNSLENNKIISKDTRIRAKNSWMVLYKKKFKKLLQRKKELLTQQNLCDISSVKIVVVGKFKFKFNSKLLNFNLKR